MEREFHAFTARFESPHQQMLQQLGVPDDILLHLPGIGVTPVEVDGSLWQPGGHGPEAVIIPAFEGPPPCFVAPVEEPEQPHDLIAFFPDRPSRWWWRVGSASVLGADRIASSHTWGTAVRLYLTPLAWLHGRCDGACLLADDAVDRLIGVTEIITGDPRLAEHIDALLRRPPAAMPAIFIETRVAT